MSFSPGKQIEHLQSFIRKHSRSKKAPASVRTDIYMIFYVTKTGVSESKMWAKVLLFLFNSILKPNPDYLSVPSFTLFGLGSRIFSSDFPFLFRILLASFSSSASGFFVPNFSSPTLRMYYSKPVWLRLLTKP